MKFRKKPVVIEAVQLNWRNWSLVCDFLGGIIGPHNPGREPGPPGEKHTDYTGMDIPEGGTNIPYWMEDPQVKKDWEAKIAENDVPSRMKPEFFDKDYKGELPKGV